MSSIQLASFQVDLHLLAVLCNWIRTIVTYRAILLARRN